MSNDDSAKNCLQAFKLILDYPEVSVSGGIVSLLCYFYLIYMYFVVKTPVLKRHPTNLAIYKCIYEVVFVSQFIWIPFIKPEKWFAPDCTGSINARVVAFFTEFAFFGGELAFLCITFDLREAYTNPFSSFKRNRKMYFTVITCIALAFATALVAPKQGVYGESVEGTIWIIPSDSASEYTAVHKLIFFYIWIIIIFFYSIWAVWVLRRKMSVGFQATLHTRMSILERARTFVTLHSTYWFVILIIQLINFFIYNNEGYSFYKLEGNQTYKILNTVVVVMLSWRGLIMLFMILATNWDGATFASLNPFMSKEYRAELIENAIQEGVLLKPNLNKALRAEVLYFTAQGIVYAARESRKYVEQDVDTSSPFHESSVESRKSLASNLGRGSYDVEEYSVKDSVYQPSHSSSNLLKDHSSLNYHHSLNQRDTFSEIAKIEEEQGSIIEKEQLRAMEEEAEDLGYLKELRESLATVRPDFVDIEKNNINLNNSLTGSGSGLEMRESVKKVSNENVRQSNLTRESLNKVSNDKNNQTRSLLKSDDSAATSVTEKWRETMDIDYSMRPSAPTNGNDARQSDSSDINFRYTGHSYNRSQHGSRESDQTSSTYMRTSNISQKLTSIFKQGKEVLSTGKDQNKNVYDDVIKFKDYAPALFAKIRAMCDISEEEYTKAFETPSANASFSEGRSGAFFFYSTDMQYFVKSTTEEEINILIRILGDYIRHIAIDKNTLINKFLGAHCITMYGKKIHFIVSKNVFGAHKISERYDLKGSWENRHRVDKNHGNIRRKGQSAEDDGVATPLFKDNDVQQKIAMPLSNTINLAEQIRRDVAFLRNCKLLDYSLLVGIKKQRFEVIKKEQDVSSASINGSSDDSIGSDEAASYSVTENATQSTGSGNDSDAMPNSIRSISNSNGGNNRVSVVSGSLHQIGTNHIYDEAPLPNALRDNPFLQNKDGSIYAGIVEGPGLFHFGIIDILGEWTWAKRMERFFKVYILQQDSDGISAMPPERYSQRFFDRCVIGLFEGLDNYEQAQRNQKGSTFNKSFLGPNSRFSKNSFRHSRSIHLQNPNSRNSYEGGVSDYGDDIENNIYNKSFQYNPNAYDGRDSISILNESERASVDVSGNSSLISR